MNFKRGRGNELPQVRKENILVSGMKNWKVPLVILGILALAIAFRWGDLGTIDKDGEITKTKIDRWNGSVWQTKVKNAGYYESMISPSWFESGRKQIEKQVEYKKPIYIKSENASSDTLGGKYQYRIDEMNAEFTEKVNNSSGEEYEYSTLGEISGYTKSYEIKTKTVQEPPSPIYWLSSNGLTRLWFYMISVVGVWLFAAIIYIKAEKKFNNMKKVVK